MIIHRQDEEIMPYSCLLSLHTGSFIYKKEQRKGQKEENNTTKHG